MFHRVIFLKITFLLCVYLLSYLIALECFDGREYKNNSLFHFFKSWNLTQYLSHTKC